MTRTTGYSMLLATLIGVAGTVMPAVRRSAIEAGTSPRVTTR